MNCVLFDFGGTIDTNGVHWSEKFWEWYQQFSIPVEKKVYERAFVASDDALLRYPGIATATFFLTLKMQMEEQFRILGLERGPVFDQMVQSGYADVTATIGRAAALLRDLRSQYALGLVSNFYGNLETVCREFALDTLFDVMIDSAIVGVRKPNPAIFSLALERLGRNPKDAYIVGDSYERDIVPGKQLGCTTIWLKGRSWTDHPSVTPDADIVINTIEELRPPLPLRGVSPL